MSKYTETANSKLAINDELRKLSLRGTNVDLSSHTRFLNMFKWPENIQSDDNKTLGGKYISFELMQGENDQEAIEYMKKHEVFGCWKITSYE